MLVQEAGQAARLHEAVGDLDQVPRVVVADEELTKRWDAERTWIFDVPDTRPKNPGPMYPDENLGFCFWLNQGGQTIEIRHVTLQSWLRWAQDVFKHELAKALGVDQFDGGDGDVQTDPARYRESCRAFYMRNYTPDKPPPTPEDMEFLNRMFFNDIPEGWE